jgi:hypothetical protein
MSALSNLNIFSNPVVTKSARERLRLRNALSWGIVVVVVTGFVYAICYKFAEVQAELREETAAKFALVAILVMQGIILMLMGTGSVAIGIAQERMNGTLDYQRMTPMSTTSKILGYLFGLPIREYFLFLLTMPFVLYAAVKSGVRMSNLAHMYVVGFISVWLYHVTGLVAGMVSPKPWRAGVATQGMVLLMYFVMPQLASLGFTFFLYLTPRPVFARLAYEELDLDLRGVVDPENLQNSVPFFNFNVNPSTFTVLLQGFLILTLFLIVYRKWREETLHPLSKGYALLVFLTTQVMLLGTLWPRITESWRFGNIADRFQRVRVLALSRVDAGGLMIGEWLYVFFFVSLAMGLLLVSLITPTRHTYAKGLRRARKLGLPRVPWLSDAASAVPYAFLFVLITWLSYAALVKLAIDAEDFFRTVPGLFSLLLPAALFAALLLYMQALCQRFGLRGMLMAMFLIWVVPFLTYALMKAAAGPPLTANYVGAPMPLNAFGYAIANLFDFQNGNVRGTLIEHAGKLTTFAVVLNTGFAVVALSMLTTHQAAIRAKELNRPVSAQLTEEAAV